MSGYVYIKSEPNLYTVGFYKPDGKWEPESDHGNTAEAAARVHWLNGGLSKSAEDHLNIIAKNSVAINVAAGAILNEVNGFTLNGIDVTVKK